MQQIGFATLYTAPRKIEDHGNISPLWLGDALTVSGDVRLYLKAVPYQELVAECLCATIGSAVGMPVLQTYVVNDPQNYLHAQYLIGSEDADMPSFKRHLSASNMNQLEFVTHALSKWRALYDAAIFDEWIANPDRNIGNFLWDGGEQWHLIDHGRALWTTTPKADPTDRFKNILVEIIQAVYQEIGIGQVKRRLSVEIPKYQSIDASKVLLASRCAEIGCVAEAQSKLVLLVNRLNELPALIARYSEQKELF